MITAGIFLSCTIILGLAGIDTEKTKKNARETARLINQISPDYLAALTLMLEPGTRFYRQMQRGEFQLPDPYAIIAELKIILEHLQVQRPCVFRSNHASNYLPIKGTLPQDKPALIKVLNQVLQSKDDRYLRPDYMRGL